MHVTKPRGSGVQLQPLWPCAFWYVLAGQPLQPPPQPLVVKVPTGQANKQGGA
jgi:hypothetical protein